MRRSVSLSHLKYSDTWRILALSVIKTAVDDAAGQNLSNHNHREEIITDAYSFFYDGRYAHWAEIAGIDPTVLPPSVEDGTDGL